MAGYNEMSLMDQYFSTVQEEDGKFAGKWHANEMGSGGVMYLRADGIVRYGAGPNDPPETTGWFDTYADVEEAYRKWLKIQTRTGS